MAEGKQLSTGETGRTITISSQLGWDREKLKSSANPPLRLWAALKDITTYINRAGDSASKDTAWKVKWVYYITAVPSIQRMLHPDGSDPWASAVTSEYENFLSEQRLRGGNAETIVLNPEQTQILKGLLGLVDIPFEGDVNGAVIPVKPLADEAEGVNFALKALRKHEEKPKRHVRVVKNEPGKILNFIEYRNNRK